MKTMKSWMKPWMNPGYLNESCAGILQGWCHFILGVLEKANTHQPRKNWRLVHEAATEQTWFFFTLKSCNVLQVPRLMRENNVGRRLTFPSILRTKSVRKPRGFQRLNFMIFSDSECALDPYGSIWSKLKLNFGMECHISLLWVEQADIMIAAVWVALKARKKALRTLNIIYNALVFEVTKMCWVLRYY